MTLTQLRYLCAVADAGSISGGAQRAFVSQPTLSAAIAALETELGARLFDRGRRGVTLTPQGEAALIHARTVLREVRALEGGSKAPARARPLRLGVLATVPPELVARVLARLQHTNPDQPWTVEDAPARSLRTRLDSGRYAAILTGLAAAPRRGYRQQVLMRDAQALAVARRRAPTNPITPGFLDGYPLIVRTHCEYLQTASRILEDWGVKPVVVARTSDDQRALQLVAAEVGACLLPDSFRHPAVVLLRPEGVRLERALGLEWSRQLAFDMPSSFDT